jgi:ATP-dependent helicase/nuclease subunit A
VHYKLDLGIDHLLIDEAQDTSLKQWEVIQRLVAEFTAGAGARGTIERSIFAVGDEKQSIFSFQGAAPRYFAEMRRRFEASHRDGGFGFAALDFKYSFRSAPVVLEAVDTVFGRPQAYEGLTADPVKTVHQAVRGRAAGLVEVWPLVEPDDRHEIEAWDAPFDTPSETAPVVKLARRIAARLKEWVGREWVGDADSGEVRLMRPGDVLVLVRQRGPLFEAVIRALKNAGIAVAGADRLLLTEHIAVMDLMVLADALLLPSDDLALATVLKTPLLGLSDDDLFVLAWNRSGTLRRALDRQAGSNSRFAAAAATLDRWAEVARREPPFAFYARVLGTDRGRARMLARLGPEAADALDEFLALALDYESRETPSLQGFVAWLRASTTEVKRDMEIGRDEVRVMTVHGAKGLEAPVVILADTTTNPSGPYPPRLLAMPSPGAPDRIVWAGAKNTDVALVAEARAHALRAAADEYRRLLYVAMTRAADRLIVCGAEGLRRRPDGCWYDLVRDALEPAAAKVAGPEGEILQLRQGTDLGDAAQLALALPPAPTDCPGWLTRDAPAVAMPAMVTPSTAILDAPVPASAAPDERGRALVRGTLIHRLMQSLPDIAPERRDAAARRYLERAHSGLTEVERQALVEQVRAVLDAPRFALLAGPGSRAEVPIVGRIMRNGRELVVSGQIDRLAITEKEILIADYKSNRPAPRQIEQVPESYLGQLALYRAVLGKLYPGRPVRAALVWTDVPDFMDISNDALDAALARITSA